MCKSVLVLLLIFKVNGSIISFVVMARWMNLPVFQL